MSDLILRSAGADVSNMATGAADQAAILRDGRPSKIDGSLLRMRAMFNALVRWAKVRSCALCPPTARWWVILEAPMIQLQKRGAR
jgi:hypothetical protein